MIALLMPSTLALALSFEIGDASAGRAPGDLRQDALGTVRQQAGAAPLGTAERRNAGRSPCPLASCRRRARPPQPVAEAAGGSAKKASTRQHPRQRTRQKHAEEDSSQASAGIPEPGPQPVLPAVAPAPSKHVDLWHRTEGEPRVAPFSVRSSSSTSLSPVLAFAQRGLQAPSLSPPRPAAR